MHLEYLAMRFWQKQLLLNYKPKKIQVRWQQMNKKPLSNISNFTCLLIKLSTTPVGCCGCLAEDRKIYPKQEEATGQFTAAFSSDIFTQPTRFPSCCEQPKASRRALLNLAEKKGMQPSCTHTLRSRYGTIGPSTHGAFPSHRRCAARPWLNIFSLIRLAWNPWPSRCNKWYLVTGTTTSWKTFQTNQSRQGARRSSIGLQMCGAAISSC